MPNLTRNINADSVHKTHKAAASQGSNLSHQMTEYMTQITRSAPNKQTKEQVRTILMRYSLDQLSRKETMALLGVDYGQLIVMMADNQLSLPTLKEAEIKKMAATFSTIWRTYQ